MWLLRNVSSLFPIHLGSFLVMRTTERMYIGEVIDIFKKSSSGRYGSIELATTPSEIQALSLRVYLPLQTMFVQILNLEEPPDDEEDDDDDLNSLVLPVGQSIICILMLLSRRWCTENPQLGCTNEFGVQKVL
ncbi:hypothetical protein K438DRAFT_1764441 [Mycena galopus ATCC 62051]|nr:hypothetical protein K438DRAFT_1764441 [Mycena galopus ATCC 62051]